MGNKVYDLEERTFQFAKSIRASGFNATIALKRFLSIIISKSGQLNGMKSLLFLFALIGSVCLSAQVVCIDVKNIDSLQANETFVNDVKSHKVILIGEAPHMMPANTYLQTELLMLLNRLVGTRTLLIEFGGSDAYLLNKYLETGDRQFYEKTFYGNRKIKQAREAIEKLYEYNASLPEGQKIKVVGLDFEREPSFTATLHKFLQDVSALPEIVELKTAIKLRNDTIQRGVPDGTYMAFVREQTSKVEPHLAGYQDWPEIRKIIYNESSYDQFYKRDGYMAEKFSALKDDRFVGSFGTMHTRKNNTKVLAGMINSKEKFKDQVLVISFHHEDSHYNPDKPIEYSFLNDRGFFSKKELKNNRSIFDGLTDCQSFLYKINPADDHLEYLKSLTDYVFFLRNQTGYDTEE